MTLSAVIEEFIKEMIKQEKGVIELQRNELANKFNCVPSQINYVIGTRFTTANGYYVESRRGGGGYIKIKEINVPKSNYIMHLIKSIDKSLNQTQTDAYILNLVENNIISLREGMLLKAATSDKTLIYNTPDGDVTRARVFKNMLIQLT